MFQLDIFLRALRPAHTVLCPARLYSTLPEFNYKKKKNCCFCVFRQGCKNACRMLADLCPKTAHVFIDRPQNCAQTSFHSCAGLRSNFGHSCSKLCPIMCRSHTKLYPNFGCSHARLCPISFAPCPFPNLAGTLNI